MTDGKGPSSQRRRLRIADIATRTGLSTATISRAINGKRWVSDDTRARVFAALEEVGYVPSGVAAGLRTGRTGLLGLMLGELRDPTALDAMQGALEAAASAKYGVVVYMTRDEQERSRMYSEGIGRGWVDGGLLLWPSYEDTPVVRRIYGGGMPLVLIEPEVEVPGVPSVHSDVFDTAYRSTKYLLNMGHRRIGVCAQRPSAWDIGRKYLAGYQAALDEVGVPFEPALAHYVGNGYEAGYESVTRLLNLSRPPTAVCCNSDTSALGAVAAARDLGRSVPEDLSVIGYDDSQMARLVRPTITTPHERFLGMARAACRLLLGILHGTEPRQEKLLIQTDIVARQSTARPHA